MSSRGRSAARNADRPFSPQHAVRFPRANDTMILRLLQKLHYRSKVTSLRRRVDRALALHRRGEVRTDGLELRNMQTTMRVEWVAREIHPWDRHIASRLRERLFTRQSLEDVDAAITRLFDQLPEADALEVRVLRDGDNQLLFHGRVERAEVAMASHSSPLMKLKSLGIKFRISNWQLEPLLALEDDGVGAN
jgi:hypothetical protein